MRPTHTPEALARIYAKPHRHDLWPDHLLRVQTTIQLARWMHTPGSGVADLSCGDAAIAKALEDPELFLGDFAPGYEFTGPIEKTLGEIPHVGTFVLSETIEHLDNPDSVLARIRTAADRLILSTPIGETVEVGNEEHYWAWDVDDVRAMLTAAGWRTKALIELTLPDTVYDYQIWGCE